MIILYAVPISLWPMLVKENTSIFILGTPTIMTVGRKPLFNKKFAQLLSFLR
jgi:hypothetical protein